MAKPLVETKARVGVFSIALGAYLPQFPQLVPEFEAQYAAFKKTLPDTIEIIDGGMVTTKEQSMQAGDKFRAADVDLVILQMLTYCTSYNMLPAVRDLDVPVVIVNVQKKLAPDSKKVFQRNKKCKKANRFIIVLLPDMIFMSGKTIIRMMN